MCTTIMGLHAISSEIITLVEPIAQTWNLTLAIYDRVGQLVVAAGAHKKLVPAVQGAGTPVAQVVSNALNLVVDRQRGGDLCRRCPLAANCSLTAEILVPLVYEQECLGALVAMGWDDEAGEGLLTQRSLRLQLLRQVGYGVVLRLYRQGFSQRVRQLEAFLQKALDLGREPALVVDPELRVVRASGSAALVLGSAPDSLCARPLTGVVPDAVSEAAGRGRAFRGLDQGGHRWDGYPVTADGEVHGMMLLVREEAEASQKHTRPERRFSLDDIRGASPTILAVKSKVRRIAATDSSVLVRGESGTGKELFARAIHGESNRRGGPFVAVNCAAIPENLLESELFGYEGGAFTGARKGGKPGKFELANGGTLLLDEVGDLPLSLQAKLLRILQFKEVERIGGTQPIAVDFRLIAATNRPLEEMITAGTFREDLFYRLNVIPLDVPPLRERMEDITLLLEYFTKRLTYVHGYRPKRWSAEAFNAICAYHWPGNLRELENAVEHAVSVEEGEMIQLSSLPERILKVLRAVAPAAKAPEPVPAPPPPVVLVRRRTASTADAAAAEALLAALERYGTSGAGKEQAARTLGISRATLYRRLKALGLS